MTKFWKISGYGKIENTKKPVDNKRDSKIFKNKERLYDKFLTLKSYEHK